MKLLMNLVNECYSEDPCWKFHAVQESSWEWVTIKVCYDRDTKSIESSSNWNNAELASVFWEAGLISSESEEELEKWIRGGKEKHKVKGLAPDTNLIIPGFMTSFLRKMPVNPYDIVPVLVIFARSIMYELHTMRPFTYSGSRRLTAKGKAFFSESASKWPLLMKLWNFKHYESITDQVGKLLDQRGRMGLKGTYEVDALHDWAPVIIVKPGHILHSPKVLEQTPFLNAVHDSLIRYEVDFMRQNTTLPILFLTNDKDQCKSATQEGIETLHVKKPFYSTGMDQQAVEHLDAEKIRLMVLSLLAKSPVVKMTSNAGDFYLSWTWKGRNMNDITEHKIRLVNEKGQVSTIDP